MQTCISLIRHDIPGLTDHDLGDVSHCRCLNHQLWVGGVECSSDQTCDRCNGAQLPHPFFRLPSSPHIETLWPSSLARWTLRNRRWIGLSFASSHFIHLGLIVSMTVLFPDPFVSEQSMAQWVFGGLAYGFVFLMALTSTDQAQRWMGMKNWKRLHFVGSHWIWTLFLLTYVKHVKEGPLWFYLPFLVFTLALIPMRYAKHHTPPKAPTGALI